MHTVLYAFLSFIFALTTQATELEYPDNNPTLAAIMIFINRYLQNVLNRANSFMYFGSISENNKNSKSGLRLNGQYYGHFNILAHKQEIQRAYIFINTHDSSRKRQKHVIREEITQSLGFLNDTYDYPESIFYQGYSESNTFSEVDKRIIKLLYQ